MEMRSSTLVAVIAVTITSACKERIDTPSAPPTDPGDEKPESGEVTQVLASGSEIPPGLEELELTKDQAGKISAWLDELGGQPDPAAYAKFVRSLLREDQRASFQNIINSGGN